MFDCCFFWIEGLLLKYLLKGLGTKKKVMKNRRKKAFYKQTRGNFSKSLSYCESL